MLAAALALVAIDVGIGFAVTSAKPCVGAAERDPKRDCAPNTSATPSPKKDDIGLEPATVTCRPTSEEPEPVCTFGVARNRAKATIALIGDSHALHWRAAVEVVAKAKRWRGYSVTTAACPYSTAVKYLPEGLREQCVTWFAAARAWFRRHPEVSTVFVSQTTRLATAAPGRTEAELKRAGYARAWSTLPRTVKRVVVLRDAPDPDDKTFECVDRAVEIGHPATRAGLPDRPRERAAERPGGHDRPRPALQALPRDRSLEPLLHPEELLPGHRRRAGLRGHLRARHGGLHADGRPVPAAPARRLSARSRPRRVCGYAAASGEARSAHGAAASICAASASRAPSWAGRPISWTASGRPSPCW